MRLSTSFPTRAAPDPAFAYLADFGRIGEWDPFIGGVERLDPGEPRVGSRYVLTAKRAGFRLRYEVVALDPVGRVVRLDGSGTGYAGWDEIRVSPAAGGGSTVTYTAEIGLRGRARLLLAAAPLVGVAMLATGGPLRGLRRRLDALATGQPEMRGSR